MALHHSVDIRTWLPTLHFLLKCSFSVINLQNHLQQMLHFDHPWICLSVREDALHVHASSESLAPVKTDHVAQMSQCKQADHTHHDVTLAHLQLLFVPLKEWSINDSKCDKDWVFPASLLLIRCRHLCCWSDSSPTFSREDTTATSTNSSRSSVCLSFS